MSSSRHVVADVCCSVLCVAKLCVLKSTACCSVLCVTAPRHLGCVAVCCIEQRCVCCKELRVAVSCAWRCSRHLGADGHDYDAIFSSNFEMIIVCQASQGGIQKLLLPGVEREVLNAHTLWAALGSKFEEHPSWLTMRKHIRNLTRRCGTHRRHLCVCVCVYECTHNHGWSLRKQRFHPILSFLSQYFSCLLYACIEL